MLLLVEALVEKVGARLGERLPEPLQAPAGDPQGLAHRHPLGPSRPISGFEILCGPVVAWLGPPRLPGCLPGRPKAQKTRPRGCRGDQPGRRCDMGALPRAPNPPPYDPSLWFAPVPLAWLRDFSGNTSRLVGGGSLTGLYKIYLCTPEDPLAVLLVGSCPAMREALALGGACGQVYGVMWEAAWHDQRGECGGTTELSHKAIADLCRLGKTTVLKAIDALLDDGLIQCLHLVPTGRGSWKRRYRVIHPDQLEAQRGAIAVMGPALLPSERAKQMLPVYSDVEAL